MSISDKKYINQSAIKHANYKLSTAKKKTTSTNKMKALKNEILVLQNAT